MQPTFKNISGITLLAVLAFFSWLMLKTIILYIPLKPDTAFLQLKQAYLPIKIWRVSFYVHVFSSLVALLAGFTQFSKNFLKSKPVLHRKLGYVYVINILCVTGPSGLIMSFYANGGLSSRIAFTLLAVLWISFTALALYKALRKNFGVHRAFMIRSYALTLSALSLRAWKVVFAEFTNIAPMDRYRIIAWLGWGLNLLIAEIIIMRLVKNKTKRPPKRLLSVEAKQV
ncbi:MAG: DUF2306 domain-containing protein [Ferruginibacter sp.]